MTFTDDDLIRLKEALMILGDTRQTFCADFKIPDLLARLEAAERCMHAAMSAPAAMIQDPGFYDAWRKAAGK